MYILYVYILSVCCYTIKKMKGFRPSLSCLINQRVCFFLDEALTGLDSETLHLKTSY